MGTLLFETTKTRPLNILSPGRKKLPSLQRTLGRLILVRIRIGSVLDVFRQLSNLLLEQIQGCLPRIIEQINDKAARIENE